MSAATQASYTAYTSMLLTKLNLVAELERRNAGLMPRMLRVLLYANYTSMLLTKARCGRADAADAARPLHALALSRAQRERERSQRERQRQRQRQRGERQRGERQRGERGEGEREVREQRKRGERQRERQRRVAKSVESESALREPVTFANSSIVLTNSWSLHFASASVVLANSLRVQVARY